MAVIEDHVDCARVLLFHPGINVNMKNNKGHTAVMDAQKKTLRLLNQMAKLCDDFPADSYGKVVLCGNSGAGKSTLAQVS